MLFHAYAISLVRRNSNGSAFGSFSDGNAFGSLRSPAATPKVGP